MAFEKVSNTPDLPCQRSTETWAFNIQVTTSATRLGDLLITAGSTAPYGIPETPNTVMRPQYPPIGGPTNSGLLTGGGLKGMRPPRSMYMQVSPAATNAVAMTMDNNSTPVATTGAEVGLQLMPGVVHIFANIGETLLRFKDGTDSIYAVDHRSSFVLIALDTVSVSVWFMD